MMILGLLAAFAIWCVIVGLLVRAERRKRVPTFAEQVANLRAAFNDLAYSVGEQLVPAVRRAAVAMAAFAEAFQSANTQEGT